MVDDSLGNDESERAYHPVIRFPTIPGSVATAFEKARRCGAYGGLRSRKFTK